MRKPRYQKRNATRNITYTAFACALITVCAWITIPTVPPFTLQTFAIFFCTAILGWKRGTIAVAVYLLLGIIGIPVFSGMMGGIERLIGPTGGYLVGFLLTAALTGWIAERGHWKTLPLILGMLAGMLAYYTFGTAWFFLNYVSQTGIAGLWTALVKCVFPFVPFDSLKIALAVYLVRRLEKLVKLDF